MVGGGRREGIGRKEWLRVGRISRPDGPYYLCFSVSKKAFVNGLWQPPREVKKPRIRIGHSVKLCSLEGEGGGNG